MGTLQGVSLYFSLIDNFSNTDQETVYLANEQLIVLFSDQLQLLPNHLASMPRRLTSSGG